MRQGGTAHHRVAEIFQRGDVRVSRADAVVCQREVYQRLVAGQTGRQRLGPVRFQPVSLQANITSHHGVQPRNAGREAGGHDRDEMISQLSAERDPVTAPHHFLSLAVKKHGRLRKWSHHLFHPPQLIIDILIPISIRNPSKLPHVSSFILRSYACVSSNGCTSRNYWDFWT